MDSVRKALQIADASLLRIVPEPQTTDNGAAFGNILSTLSDVATSVAGAGLGAYGPMMQEQLKVQQEMLQITMISNIQRSKHETEMAPVRNLRVG